MIVMSLVASSAAVQCSIPGIAGTGRSAISSNMRCCCSVSLKVMMESRRIELTGKEGHVLERRRGPTIKGSSPD